MATRRAVNDEVSPICNVFQWLLLLVEFLHLLLCERNAFFKCKMVAKNLHGIAIFFSLENARWLNQAKIHLPRFVPSFLHIWCYCIFLFCKLFMRSTFFLWIFEQITIEQLFETFLSYFPLSRFQMAFKCPLSLFLFFISSLSVPFALLSSTLTRIEYDYARRATIGCIEKECASYNNHSTCCFGRFGCKSCTRFGRCEKIKRTADR